VPKNNFWFLLICLYLLIPSLFIPSYFFKIFNYFNLLCFSPVKRNNYSRPNNFLFSKQNLFFIFCTTRKGSTPTGLRHRKGKAQGSACTGVSFLWLFLFYLIFRVAQGSISTGVKITTLCHPVLVRN